jgi:hypothetical protein
MSGYNYTSAQGSPILSVEQARRRNAELRIELEALTAEHAELLPLVEAMRRVVEPLRRAVRGTGPSHGTVRKFDEGCRCQPCETAKRAKSARQRARKAEAA